MIAHVSTTINTTHHFPETRTVHARRTSRQVVFNVLPLNREPLSCKYTNVNNYQSAKTEKQHVILANPCLYKLSNKAKKRKNARADLRAQEGKKECSRLCNYDTTLNKHRILCCFA